MPSAVAGTRTTTYQLPVEEGGVIKPTSFGTSVVTSQKYLIGDITIEDIALTQATVTPTSSIQVITPNNSIVVNGATIERTANNVVNLNYLYNGSATTLTNGLYEIYINITVNDTPLIVHARQLGNLTATTKPDIIESIAAYNNSISLYSKDAQNISQIPIIINSIIVNKLGDLA